MHKTRSILDVSGVGEEMILPSALFRRCLEKAYIHVENGGDYATERREGILYIYLEHSVGATDWKNNFDFPARPYRKMKEGRWFAHRGFVRVWKSVEKHLSVMIEDKTLCGIVVVGYSHGAALAVLCYEYIYFHRPELRDRIVGYAFGCPRVLWGWGRRALHRWEHFFVFRNGRDLVTHLPPALLGYRHVGTFVKIGEREGCHPIDSHRPEHIYRALLLYEGVEERRLLQSISRGEGFGDTIPSF